MFLGPSAAVLDIACPRCGAMPRPGAPKALPSAVVSPAEMATGFAAALPHGYPLRSRRARPKLLKESVLSLVFACCGFFGLAMASFVFSPLAIWTGTRARQRIANSPSRYAGRRLATAGIVVAVISLSIAMILAAIVGTYMVIQEWQDR
jgi:nitric oxide reductase large subunit